MADRQRAMNTHRPHYPPKSQPKSQPKPSSTRPRKRKLSSLSSCNDVGIMNNVHVHKQSNMRHGPPLLERDITVNNNNKTNRNSTNNHNHNKRHTSNTSNRNITNNPEQNKGNSNNIQHHNIYNKRKPTNGPVPKYLENRLGLYAVTTGAITIKSNSYD